MDRNVFQKSGIVLISYLIALICNTYITNHDLSKIEFNKFKMQFGDEDENNRETFDYLRLSVFIHAKKHSSLDAISNANLRRPSRPFFADTIFELHQDTRQHIVSDLISDIAAYLLLRKEQAISSSSNPSPQSNTNTEEQVEPEIEPEETS